MYAERKGNRLKGYDYSKAGYYYITICVNKNQKVLGRIENGIAVLNQYGLIVNDYVHQIPSWFRHVHLDCLIIMPDHIHLILIFEKQERNLSGVVGTFKSQSTKKLRIKGLKDFCWKRSFYDRILRNDPELNSIREYILSNPLRAEIKNKNSMKY